MKKDFLFIAYLFSLAVPYHIDFMISELKIMSFRKLFYYQLLKFFLKCLFAAEDNKLIDEFNLDIIAMHAGIID